MTIINRYITREALTSWLGVTGVLLLILLISRFARFLGEAAAGRISEDVVFALLGLSSIYYLILLIPPALFLGILLAMGRLYRDSEMSALGACGVGGADLYRPLLRLALVLGIFVALLAMIIGPWAGQTAYKLRAIAQFEASVGLVEAGRFTSLGGGVFFTEAVSDDRKSLEGLFLYREFKDKQGELLSDVVVAERGRQDFNRETGERSLVLYNGHRYEGVPGSGEYRIAQFEEQGIQLYLDTPEVQIDRRAFLLTEDLWGSDDLANQAEMQWRIAVPFSVLFLTLLAVPLGRVRPRQGRYGKILWGVLLYVIYFNLLGICKLWIEKGDLPAWLGMWPAHAVLLMFTLWLAHKEGLIFVNGVLNRPTAAAAGTR